eukprot:m.121034 g.121034  ORF g.121034 m.121034 type:complete len:139 (-) comp23264_c0_seq1:148-564(-)
MPALQQQLELTPLQRQRTGLVESERQRLASSSLTSVAASGPVALRPRPKSSRLLNKRSEKSSPSTHHFKMQQATVQPVISSALPLKSPKAPGICVGSDRQHQKFGRLHSSRSKPALVGPTIQKLQAVQRSKAPSSLPP